MSCQLHYDLIPLFPMNVILSKFGMQQFVLGDILNLYKYYRSSALLYKLKEKKTFYINPPT